MKTVVRPRQHSEHREELFVRMGAVLLFVAIARGLLLGDLGIFGVDLVFLCTWIVVFFNLRRILSSLRKARLRIVLGLYLSGLAISTLVQGVQPSNSASFINYLSIFILALYLTKTRTDVVYKVLGLAIIFHSVVGWAEFVSRQTLTFSTWKIYEATFIGNFQRASSTIGDPNYLAFAVMVLVVCQLYLRSRGMRYRNDSLVIIVGLSTVLITFSRTGLVSLALLLFGFLILDQRARRYSSLFFTFMLFSVLLFTTVLPQSNIISVSIQRFANLDLDASFGSRSLLQTSGFELFLANWVVGLGPGRFEEIAATYYDPSKPFNLQTAVLNTYLQVGLVAGILGLISLLVFLILSGKVLWEQQKLALGGYVGLILFLATLDTLLNPFLWVLFGVLLSGTEVTRDAVFDSNRKLQRQRHT
jgi:O-antigen ligase